MLNNDEKELDPEKSSTKENNKNNFPPQNKTGIIHDDLPTHIDSEEHQFFPNTYTINEIMDINNHNLNHYKNSRTKILYSEENLKYLNNIKHTNFYLSNEVNTPTNISYNDLLLVLKENDPYKINKNNKFVYKNYDSNNNIFFNSKFESGNLRMAIKHSENEYDLIIRPDTNTLKAFNWFYFSIKLNDNFIKNLNKKNGTIKFNIINFCKKGMLFNEMIRVLTYYNDNWKRNTHNIFYYQNDLSVEFNQINKDLDDENEYNSSQLEYKNKLSFYTLTFSFDFNLLKNKEGQIIKNIIYFSYCYPYTYSDLTNLLANLINKYSNGDILRFETIGNTINDKPIYMLVITDFSDSFDVLAKKNCVFLTGRVHPGESNGSYMVEGLIQFLISNDHVAFALRKHYIFKIIPMLNPDGVIIGNYRNNLFGRDLNREWVDADIHTSPSIHYAKQAIIKTLNSRDIFLFCDFHGHSQKNNFFLYSCKSKSTSTGGSNLNTNANNFNNCKKSCSLGNNTVNYLNDNNNVLESDDKPLVFPYIFSKENTFFDLSSCINKIGPTKIKTARAVMKNEFNIDYSYCLESSIASTKANSVYVPFNINLYKRIGQDFCISLFKMSSSKIFFSTLNFIRLEKKDKKKFYYSNNPSVKNFYASNVKNSLPLIGGNSYSGTNLNVNNNNLLIRKGVLMNKNPTKIGSCKVLNYSIGKNNLFPTCHFNNFNNYKNLNMKINYNEHLDNSANEQNSYSLNKRYRLLDNYYLKDEYQNK